MKRGLISIAAMIPLLVATVESFVELRRAPGGAVADASDERYREIQTRVEAARQTESESEAQLAADVHMAQQLAAADLLEGAKLAATPKALSPALQTATEKWQKFDAAREFVLKTKDLRLLRPRSNQPPANKAEADEEVREIADFSGRIGRDALTADFPPSVQLFALVDTRKAALDQAIERFEEEKRVMAAVTQVRDHFQARRFEECLRALDRTELKNLENSELKAEFDTLRRRAQFGSASMKLLASTPSSFSDEDLAKVNPDNLRKSYEEFFRVYPAAPSHDDEGDYTELMRRRDLLEMNLAIGHLRSAPDVTALLDSAAKICGSQYAERALKSRTKTIVRQWLTSERGLAEKQRPLFLQDDKKEAITIRGQRKLGFFLLPEGAAQWRYWADKQGYDTHTPGLGTERFGEGDFLQPPGTPQYLKWLDEFNETSKHLVNNTCTLQEWQRFGVRCAEMQKELVHYRDQYGIKDEPDATCRDWDFGADAALIHDLIEQWEWYDKVQHN